MVWRLGKYKSIKRLHIFYLNDELIFLADVEFDCYSANIHRGVCNARKRPERTESN